MTTSAAVECAYLLNARELGRFLAKKLRQFKPPELARFAHLVDRKEDFADYCLVLSATTASCSTAEAGAFRSGLEGHPAKRQTTVGAENDRLATLSQSELVLLRIAFGCQSASDPRTRSAAAADSCPKAEKAARRKAASTLKKRGFQAALEAASRPAVRQLRAVGDSSDGNNTSGSLSKNDVSGKAHLLVAPSEEEIAAVGTNFAASMLGSGAVIAVEEGGQGRMVSTLVERIEALLEELLPDSVEEVDGSEADLTPAASVRGASDATRAKESELLTIEDLLMLNMHLYGEVPGATQGKKLVEKVHGIKPSLVEKVATLCAEDLERSLARPPLVRPGDCSTAAPSPREEQKLEEVFSPGEVADMVLSGAVSGGSFHFVAEEIRAKLLNTIRKQLFVAGKKNSGKRFGKISASCSPSPPPDGEGGGEGEQESERGGVDVGGSEINMDREVDQDLEEDVGDECQQQQTLQLSPQQAVQLFNLFATLRRKLSLLSQPRPPSIGVSNKGSGEDSHEHEGKFPAEVRADPPNSDRSIRILSDLARRLLPLTMQMVNHLDELPLLDLCVLGSFVAEGGNGKRGGFVFKALAASGSGTVHEGRAKRVVRRVEAFRERLRSAIERKCYDRGRRFEEEVARVVVDKLSDHDVGTESELGGTRNIASRPRGGKSKRAKTEEAVQ
eukprot:g16292.t1